MSFWKNSKPKKTLCQSVSSVFFARFAEAKRRECSMHKSAHAEMLRILPVAALSYREHYSRIFPWNQYFASICWIWVNPYAKFSHLSFIKTAKFCHFCIFEDLWSQSICLTWAYWAILAIRIFPLKIKNWWTSILREWSVGVLRPAVNKINKGSQQHE